jgi:hypothetical protein
MRRAPALVLIALLALAAVGFGAPNNEDIDVDSEGDETDYTRLDQDEEGMLEDGDVMDFCVQLERVHGSSSAMGAALGDAGTCSAGGRPPSVPVDEAAFERACHEGATIRELQEAFGCNRERVKYLKRKLGLSGLLMAAEQAALPTAEALQAAWTADRGDASLHRLPVSDALVVLAGELGISINALRRHMRAVGFAPKHPFTGDQVLAALERLFIDPCCNSFGVTFAEGSLRSEFGMVVRRSQIRSCLKQLDPEGHRARAKQAAKTSFEYNVPGPRSLYHADGHEKIAKLWGIWIHGCIDGYSRYIVYLVAASDKLATTVRDIFVEACDREGWPSRGRWDKGSENRLAILALIDHHYDEARPETLTRGSAITGRSVQNCRIEYLWRFVKTHVSSKFRATFFEMQRRGLLNPNSEIDLFYLQFVFLPIVQQYLDRFRRMWNSHLIAGRRTTAGHGGGVPSELFQDPIYSQTVLNDDARYSTQSGTLGNDARGRPTVDTTSAYGAEAVTASEPEEVTAEQLTTRDPLAFSPFLQRLRERYLSAIPLAISTAHLTAQSSDWEKMERYVQEYIRFRELNGELIRAALEYWSDDGEFDWVRFGASSGGTEYSRMVSMRTELVRLAAEMAEEERQRE